MADSERNLIEEVDYLSGCVVAHDFISVHLAKILVATGAIESVDLEGIMLEAEIATSRLSPEMQEGYSTTLQTLRGSLDR